MNFIDVTQDLIDNNNITLLIVCFASQRKVFNLKMTHERAETCRDKLCKNILVLLTLNKLCLAVFYLYFVILYNTTGMLNWNYVFNVSIFMFLCSLMAWWWAMFRAKTSQLIHNCKATCYVWLKIFIYTSYLHFEIVTRVTVHALSHHCVLSWSHVSVYVSYHMQGVLISP